MNNSEKNFLAGRFSELSKLNTLFLEAKVFIFCLNIFAFLHFIKARNFPGIKCTCEYFIFHDIFFFYFFLFLFLNFPDNIFLCYIFIIIYLMRYY